MKKIILIPVLLFSLGLYAQVPEDVLRYSYFPQNGTARSLAIGGAMGSLGGDISSLYVNPAGLGNYKTGEFVFSPGFAFNNNKNNFRGTDSKNNKSNFTIGPIGLVYGSSDRYQSGSSQAIAFGVTQVASYNNIVQYRGYNNASSFSEQYAEQIAKSGQTIDQILNNSTYAYGAAPALYTYLVDTFTMNGNTVVRGLPEGILDAGQALLQENTVKTSGGLYEIAFGYAMNKKDKFQWGFGIGLPILNYKSETTYSESDTSANAQNNFKSFTYTDNFTTKGAGLNLKLGFIYKPTDYLRLGLAIHSPTYMLSMKDTRTTNLTVDTEDYAGVNSVSSTLFTNDQAGQSSYTMLTPFKMLVSGSYVFKSVEDVGSQKGFVTADIEYVNHRGSNFYSANEQPDENERAYYKDLSSVIKSEYKGALNFRLGGELKFNTIMARLGAAYYGNPYKDPALKAERFLTSAGIGYRNKGFFVDLTYVLAFNKDVNVPYRLEDRANTFASLKDQRSNVVATVGVKF